MYVEEGGERFPQGVLRCPVRQHEQQILGFTCLRRSTSKSSSSLFSNLSGDRIEEEMGEKTRPSKGEKALTSKPERKVRLDNRQATFPVSYSRPLSDDEVFRLSRLTISFHIAPGFLSTVNENSF